MNAVTSTQVHTADTEARSLVRIVIVGHVDHGKSTLIGRLLYETDSLPDGKLESLKASSAKRGMAFEWSFVLDSLQAERDQNITIDTSQVRFRTPARDFVLIDAPGHAEFLRNMITGAAQADAAILVIDATEGVREQTRRHCHLLQLLGVRQIVVVINKMDRIAYDAGRFYRIETEITDHLKGLGLTPAAVIPVSARDGVGITEHTYTFEWYRPTVIEALDRLSPERPAPELPLRFPVQAIYKFDDKRILAGRIESGRIAVGDDVVALPSGVRSRIKSIEAWHGGPAEQDSEEATAGQSIGLTLTEPIFLERGYVLSHLPNPPHVAQIIRARVFWLHADLLSAGDRVSVSVGPAETWAAVTVIHSAIDAGKLAPTSGDAIAQNHVGEIELALERPFACDHYETNAATGRVVLKRGGRIAGGGIILASNVRSTDSLAATDSSSGAGCDELEGLAQTLASSLAALPPPARIARLRDYIGGKIVFTTSFGLEDQIILHWIAESRLDIDVVTLDTGRLFPETYQLWADTERRYGRRIRPVHPHHTDLQALVAAQGINGFYDSREARLACCHVRKIEPLNRALAGARAWIAGLRADQSGDRAAMKVTEFDWQHSLLKLNPLFDWSRQQALAFATESSVPISPLHARGFVSIGCAPCTRAIAPGESERAGRWWWEGDTKKECGLHTTQNTG